MNDEEKRKKILDVAYSIQNLGGHDRVKEVTQIAANERWDELANAAHKRLRGLDDLGYELTRTRDGLSTKISIVLMAADEKYTSQALFVMGDPKMDYWIGIVKNALGMLKMKLEAQQTKIENSISSINAVIGK